ncbi:MAG: hypothetical protein R3B45_00785 [Bdellovibrionota bacterium]
MKMLLSRIVLFGLSIGLTYPATAEWVSGGGLLIRDSQNPWFVKNTRKVNYCVSIDEANFGQTLEGVRSAINQAIQFWKSQFATNSDNQDLKIGTQIFVETECTLDPELVLQFGILSDEQKKKLGDPKELIGIAVRTSYDRRTLRGKGFIYIAPAFGPLRPSLPNMQENPWANVDDSLLMNAIAHELGHVFGVPHFPVPNHFMSDTYLENLVQTNRNIPNSLSPVFYNQEPFKIWKELRQNGGERLFFKVPSEFPCINYNSLGVDMEVYASSCRPNGQAKLMGHIDFKSTGPIKQTFQSIKLVVYSEQKIFDKVDHSYGNYGVIFGPSQQSIVWKGVFYSFVDHSSKQIFMKIYPYGNRFELGGILDGKLIMDLKETIQN